MEHSSPRRPQAPPGAPAADAPKRNYWLALSAPASRAIGLLTSRLDDASFVRVVALPDQRRCLAVVRLGKPARPGGVRARAGDACTHARHALLSDFACGPGDLSWGSVPRVGRPRRVEPETAAEPEKPAVPSAPSAAPPDVVVAAVPRRWVLV